MLVAVGVAFPTGCRSFGGEVRVDRRHVLIVSQFGAIVVILGPIERRPHERSLSTVVDMSASDRLQFSVGGNPPQPFECSEPEPVQPWLGPAELEDPDRHDEYEDLSSAERIEAEESVEHQQPDDGLGEVVGERHPPNRSEPLVQSGCGSLVPQGNHSDVAERHRNRGHDVGHGPDQGDVATPVIGHVDNHAQDRERKPDTETDPGHAAVKRRRLQALDDLGPEQTDADEHGAEGTAPEVEDERHADGGAHRHVLVDPVLAEVGARLDGGLGDDHRHRRHGDAESAGDEQGTG